MATFTLPKTGTEAHIELLDEAALGDVLALQEISRACLPEDKKRFIILQSPAYFQNLLTRRTGVMIGVRTDGMLIAQMAVYGPVELREAIALKLITRNDLPFHHASLTDNVVIYKSMTAHPEWRGNDLSKNMLIFADALPLTRAAHHAFAQVSVGNKRSWDAFARQHFGIVAAAYDPEDGMARFIFQKPTFGFDFAPEIIADDADPVADFSAIANLTQREALIGLYGPDCTEKLIFLRNRESVNILPTLARIQAAI